jgi:hypothetical protein
VWVKFSLLGNPWLAIIQVTGFYTKAQPVNSVTVMYAINRRCITDEGETYIDRVSSSLRITGDEERVWPF